MRKSIFEIASENINMKNEVKRILTIAKSEQTLCVDDLYYYTIFKFVDTYCFEEWSHRNHFINVDDLLSTLKFQELTFDAQEDTDSLLILIELIYNFWFLCYQKLAIRTRDYSVKWCGNFLHLQQIMDDVLERYNHTVKYDNDCVLVIEDNSAITAAAEILPQKLALDVIKYNHHSLKGDIGAKKSILLALGDELEAKRNLLKELNKQVTDDIFFMLNNLNIRHNNVSEDNQGKYKEYVAKMPQDELESWYDELYQMMLLAFLLLDNQERAKNFKELKAKINGGN